MKFIISTVDEVGLAEHAKAHAEVISQIKRLRTSYCFSFEDMYARETMLEALTAKAEMIRSSAKMMEHEVVI
jgi:hypothetical protein